MIDNEMRDFRLGGAELDATKRARSRPSRRSSPRSAPSSTSMCSTPRTRGPLRRRCARAGGRPGRRRRAGACGGGSRRHARLRADAADALLSAGLQYAENSALRATMHRGFATIASDVADNPALDNGPLIERIVLLRGEVASLLGYRNFAESRWCPRWRRRRPRFSRSCATSRGARAVRRARLRRARGVRAEALGLIALEAWDLSYVSEKLKARRYAYSEQEIKQYLPEEKVVAGLFRLVETIYGITIRETQAPVWHPSVRFFEVRDLSNEAAGALPASSTSTSMRAKASKAARGWTTRSTAGASTAACSTRWRT